MVDKDAEPQETAHDQIVESRSEVLLQILVGSVDQSVCNHHRQGGYTGIGVLLKHRHQNQCQHENCYFDQVVLHR